MKKYLFFLKKYKWKIITTIILIALLTTLEVVTPYINGLFIDSINFTDLTRYFLVICILVAVAECAEILFTYLEEVLKNTLTERLVFDFKKHILNHLSNISIIQYKKYDIAYTSKKIDEDVRQFWEFYMSYSVFAVFKVFKIIATLFIIFNANFIIGASVLILTPIYYFVYKKFMNPLFSNTTDYKEKSAIYFHEVTNQLFSIEDKRIQANDGFYEKKLNGAYQDNFNSFERYIKTTNLFTGLQSFLRALLLVISCIVGGYAVLGGYITLGRYSILSSYFRTILTSLSYFADITKNYQNAKASAARIDELLSVPQIEEGSIKVQRVESIDAVVNFGINDKMILSDVELHFRTGELIGILGGNGAGKSTLSKILIGVIKSSDNSYVQRASRNSKYQSCEIIYNGEYRIEDIDTRYLRRQCLSYVNQRVDLENVTMNYLFGEIAGIGTADELLLLLHEKGMPLDEDNKRFVCKNWDNTMEELSGGDRQFVTIMVSMLKQSSLFILDEPTSNLDKNRINWLKGALETLKADKIILVITHDVNMMEVFDRVVAL